MRRRAKPCADRNGPGAATPGPDDAALGASDISDVVNFNEAALLVPGRRGTRRGVHPETIRRWVRSGVLRSWKSASGLEVTTRQALLACMGVPRSESAAVPAHHTPARKTGAELDAALDGMLSGKRSRPRSGSCSGGGA